MAASRLPGKVLADLCGKPMLAWVVERARRAQKVAETAVATTTDAEDDAIAELCEARGYAYTRGSMHDVLDRYYQAAREYRADVVVRLTADCPLMDPALIDELLDIFLSSTPPLDFAANRLPMQRTIPIGLDVEVCSFTALETAWREAKVQHQREHVMPYFYENPRRFHIYHHLHDPDYGGLRWTVDTPEDLELLRQILSHFPGRDDFSWHEVLELVQAHPELEQVNAAVRHKDYREVDARR